MAAEQGSRSVLDENAVKRIVEAKIAEYSPEIERMVCSAVKKSMAAEAGGAAQRSEMRLRAEKTIAEAFSGMPHVISVSYVLKEDNCWLLFIIHDSDRRGNMTEQLVDRMTRVEGMPSMPVLDAQIRHVSGTAHAPPEAKVIFAKR